MAAELKDYTTKVAGSNEHDEFMVTRIDKVKPALNIVSTERLKPEKEGSLIMSLLVGPN